MLEVPSRARAHARAVFYQGTAGRLNTRAVAWGAIPATNQDPGYATMGLRADRGLCPVSRRTFHPPRDAVCVYNVFIARRDRAYSEDLGRPQDLSDASSGSASSASEGTCRHTVQPRMACFSPQQVHTLFHAASTFLVPGWKRQAKSELFASM